MTIKITSSKKLSFVQVFLYCFSQASIAFRKFRSKRNYTIISNGDTTPSLTDFTDFGTVPSGNKFSRSFVLKNTGTSTLTFLPRQQV